MRIDRLSLARYGCFTDVTLELGAAGLHVVVGPNEAGKSTSRAAVTDLLFGYPVRTPQAHIHSTSDLCLSADLMTGRGPLSIERHKRRPQLRSPEGEPLEEDAIVSSPVTRELYEALFAMGHEELRAGAAEILHTRGDIGRILFGVTAGRAGAAAVLDQLRAEADELFKPRSQKRGVMAAVASYADAGARLAAASLPPATWSRAADELRDVDDEIAARQSERVRCASELADMRKLLTALPLLTRRASAFAARAQLDGPYLAPETRERVSDASRKATEATRTERSALEELGHLIPEEDAAGPPPDNILTLEEEVRALQERLGVYRNDLLDLPRLRERVAVAEAALSAAARRCGFGTEAASGQDAVPPVAAQAEALLLAAALEEAQREGAQASAVKAQAKTALDRAASTLEDHPVGPSTAPLQRHLSHLRSLATAAERARDHAARAESVFEEQRRLRDEHASLNTLPTTTELSAVRGLRDERWGELRSSWSAGRSFDEVAADQFERDLATADALADRRHSDAEAAGRLAALEEALLQAAAQRDEATDALSAIELSYENAVSALRDALGEVAPMSAAAAVGCDAASLIRLVETVIDDSSAAVLERTQLESAVDAAKVALRDAESDEATFLAALEQLHQRWAVSCAAIGVPSHFSPTAVRAHLEALRDLAQASGDVGQSRSDLEVVRARIAAFEEAVAAVLAKVTPPTTDESVEAAALDLNRRLRAAVDERAVSAAAAERRTALMTRAESASLEHAVATATLSEIASEHSLTANDLDAAATASERRDELDSEIAEIEQLITEAAGGSAVSEIEALAADHEAASAIDLDEKVIVAARRLEEIDEALGALLVRRGELRNTLASWRGADDAARAADEMQEAAATVSEGATRYARLRIAHEILRREIERNREENQGPVLRRAAVHLAALTSNRFVDILDAVDEGAVLDVRRYDGEVVGVERLSEGTRDQLWLALRLAALEHWCTDREPLPLVLDDVCMTFDDERTGAALKLLAELSDRMQVLFFTHHESVAATATRVAPAGRVHVHRLERFNPPVAEAPPRRARTRKSSPAA